MDPDPDPCYFFKIYWGFLTKIFFVLFFSLIFMLKLDEPFRKQEIFIISLFSIVQIWVESKFFFCSFWLIFCPLDPDPGSQNLADPTDPDPKHC